MNIVSKVTVKHLKQNKKRTIVTILGIVLSVALITAISAFAESFLDMMRQTVISREGEWHVLFENVEKEDISAITEDDRVEEFLLSKNMGCALLEGGKNEDKPYLLVKAYNDAAMKEYPTTLIEGRYPERADEIVLPEHLNSNGGITWKVGDTLELKLGKRVAHENGEAYEIPDSYGLESGESLENVKSASYTVVGIIERPDFEGYGQASYTALTYLDVNSADLDSVNVAVRLKSLDNSLYDWGDNLARSLGVENSFNNSLLSYYLLSGNDTIVSMLSTVKWVMMLIVAAGSVAVIYSSFAISISERNRYLGMLSSVGATKKQKRNSVFTEALILGAIGIPLGLLLGFAGVFVTTRCIRGLVAGLFNLEHVTMRVVISWPAVLGAVLLAAATIFVSAWIPALRASRITPVEAIRQNKDIKLSTKQVKTSRITRKLFGFEGELALKNLKRNKKRYRATVLSLVFCIAMYLSVSSFTAYLRGAYRMGMGIDSANMPDITVSLYDTGVTDGESELSGEEKNKDWIENLQKQEAVIKSLDGITSFTSGIDMGLNFWLKDGNVLSDGVKSSLELNEPAELNGQNVGPYNMWFQVIGLDEDSLREYARRTGADESVLYDSEKMGVIVVNRRMDITNGRRSWKTIFDVKAGDVLEGIYSGYGVENTETGEYEESIGEMGFTVAAVTEELPLGGGYNVDINRVSLYTTFENALKIGELMYGPDVSWSTDMEICIRTDNHDALMEKLEELESGTDINMFAYSIKDELNGINNILLLINVFVYGFIILTALICVTSIFNTISTSMALRRREYAMLKSVGMDPGRFSRMIAYESVFYGMKALLYGLPIGLALMYGIYLSIADAIDTGFYIIWSQVIIAVISVMVVVGITMWYSSRKIKKANIVDALKDENI